MILNHYPINPETPNAVVARNTLQLRKDGFPSSWQDGVLITTATWGQVAMSTGNALWLGKDEVTFFPDTIGLEVHKQLLDRLTRDHTAFASFQDLLDAKGGYFPSIMQAPAAYNLIQKVFLASGGVITREQYYAELDQLAVAYDTAQEMRGDSRRAFRS